jgi:N12 class adenine-specific DNA methylase
MAEGARRHEERETAVKAPYEAQRHARNEFAMAHQPEWKRIEFRKQWFEALRINDEPFVAIPTTGRRSAPHFEVLDLRDSSKIVALLRDNEVRGWLFRKFEAERDTTQVPENIAAAPLETRTDGEPEGLASVEIIRDIYRGTDGFIAIIAESGGYGQALATKLKQHFNASFWPQSRHGQEVVVVNGTETQVRYVLDAIQHAKNLAQTVQPDVPQTVHVQVPENTAAAPQTSGEQAEDFDLAGENIGTGGLRQKYRDNIAAIRILKTMDAESRKATPDERKAIARYVGWGALKSVFDPENRQWAKEHEELKGLLTESEFSSARASILNAHYTSPTVVSAIHDALRQVGFQSGRVLEPSVGVGNFFGLMPADMRKPSQLHGVELDPLTAKIAAALYPSAKIKNCGFQDFDIPAEYFDVAIGNPPFGNEPLVDAHRAPYSGFSIHNFFFAKTIDKLRPGGLMTMVVSRYFLDAINDSARKWIGERADLISAVRLPYTAFKQNAGTEVVTDILLFRKRELQTVLALTPEKLAECDAIYKNDSLELLREILEFTKDDFASNSDNEDLKREALEQLRAYIAHREQSEGRNWINVGTLETVDETTGETVQHRINNYYLTHPENVLGTHAATSTMYRANDYNVEPSGDLAAQLDEWVARLPTVLYTPVERTTEQEAADVAIPDGVKEGSYFVGEDGAIMIRGRDRLGVRTAVPWEAPNAKAIERMTGMIALRDGLRTQMRMELSDAPTGEIETGRAALNRQYDVFHKSFGFVHDATNLRLFCDDTEASLLLALEFDYDKGVSKAVAERDGVEPKPPSARKADILLQRVLFPPSGDIRVESAKDALLASLNYMGGLDLAYMESVYPGRDAETIVTELGDLVFDDPVDGLVMADEYLSGDVKTRMTEAKAAALDNPAYRRNVLALEKVIPADKRPSEINASLGASFIPAGIFEQFAEHVTGARPRMGYIKTTGQWSINHTGSYPDPALNITKWGTPDMPAVDIFKSTMEGRGVVVKKPVRLPNGTEQLAVLHDKTEAAREKQREMKDEWKRWLWSDPERADRVATLFNEKLNRTVPRTFDGSHLTLPGLSPTRELLPHQKNAVWRALQSRQILLDHVVGAGKTAAIVATAMEMRRLGIARKPLIAVPNHLTMQWQSEFFKFFPAARVLAATPDDFSKGNREKFFAKIVTGDWDAVIVGHSSLKKIGLPAETEHNVLRKQVKELALDIEEMKHARNDKHIVRDMERIKARLEAQMEAKQQKVGERDKALTFDELGIDALAIDEIHEFKNLFYNSTMDKVPGMGNPTGSDKAFDLFVKTQWLWETFGNKAIIIGATGTPVSNSMVEMFNLQRYMQYPTLDKNGLNVFDSWARQFADASSVYEVSPSGTGYRQSSRLEFAGLNALMPLYQSFTDTVTLDQLKAQELARGKVFPVPKIRGGQPVNVVAPRSPQVATFMGIPQLEIDGRGQPCFGFDPERDKVEIERTKEGRWNASAEVPTPNGSSTHRKTLATTDTEEDARLAVVQAALSPVITVDPDSILGQFNDLRNIMRKTNGKVNALSLTGLANKAGLDYRLIDPAAPDFPGSKINSAINQMLALYRKWDADKGTQLVFCDLSVPLSARQKMAAQDMRIYVRDPETGALQHKRGTLHTVKDREELPYYVVKESSLFSIYDAASGAYIGGAGSKDAARGEAEQHLNDDELRSEWAAKRERLGEIRQDDIDEYNAAHNYDENADGAVISVADITGVSGSQGFSVYDDIKQKLAARGVPANEIAFIHDYATPTAKDKLFRATNRGDVRFLLGSTPKMGAGTNVQERLVGLHHIDAPWRPSDLEQREGRIVRQGNKLYQRDPEGFEVAIFRYATEQTYDTRRWQILEHKARMISQVRNWDGTLNSIEDIGSEAANAADMKAAASGDPLILEETKLRNEVNRLESLQATHHDQAVVLAREAGKKEYATIKHLPPILNKYIEMQREVEKHPLIKDVFPGITVDGHTITDRNQAIDAINAKIMKVFKDSTVATFSYRGVDFVLDGEHEWIVSLETATRTLEDFTRSAHARLPSPPGFLTRFANFVEQVPHRIKELKEDIARETKEATDLRIAAQKPFDKGPELDAARAEHKRVQRQLIAKGPEIPAEQRPLLDAAMRRQREALEKIGFGDALRGFLGQAQERNADKDTPTHLLATTNKNSPKIHSLLANLIVSNLDKNAVNEIKDRSHDEQQRAHVSHKNRG